LLTQSSPYSSTVPGSTTTVKDDSTNIAIIGGGITGLASAHYLLQYLPNANITLYEASDRMGGWLQSKHVNIGDGKIVFEQGPRNLRPKTTSGLATLEMVDPHESLVNRRMLKLLCRLRQ
jgi:protoporphyrinogen oxidase